MLSPDQRNWGFKCKRPWPGWQDLEGLREGGASNRNRTGTPFQATDFKSVVSTDFTIEATLNYAFFTDAISR
jgi:hypothetical protein